MNLMDLKEEDILGQAIYDHWYYIAKGRALRQFLGSIKVPQVLDVGAGSGIFSRQLLDAGICDSAICVDPNYDKEHIEEHNGKTIEFTRSIDNTTQHLSLMMDVLEHVPDDTALVKEYSDTMEKGAYVLITVPAFSFLWSGHDVFLEHYRRYTPKMLHRAVQDAGLEVVQTRLFFASLFPLVALIRLVKNVLRKKGAIEPRSELAIYPKWLNKLLIAIHGIERVSLFRINKLAGLSIFCLCRKP